MSSFITTVRPILTFVARDLEKEELHRDYRGSLRFASCSQLRDEEMNVLMKQTPGIWPNLWRAARQNPLIQRTLKRPVSSRALTFQKKEPHHLRQP